MSASTAVREGRTKLRRNLKRVRAVNVETQRLTSLGMHFIPAPDDTPILVQVEVNVGRLLTELCWRVCKSKRGLATAARGAVRVSIATPDGFEAVARSMPAPAENKK